MLVQTMLSDYSFVETISNSRYSKMKTKFRVVFDMLLTNLLRSQKGEHFSTPYIGIDVSDNKLIQEADVIHLHWIYRGFISLKTIRKIGKLGKPIVWTLHDSGVFTGGCHTTGECKGYENECCECKVLKSNKKASEFNKEKKIVLDELNVQIVAPSAWIADKASRSSILENKIINVVPNCIDTTIFKPLDKNEARKLLNIPMEKNVILFQISKSENKGMKFIEEVIRKLNDKDTLKENFYVGFGSSNLEFNNADGIQVKCLGKIYDIYTLVAIYSAADVYISPSLEESFGQTYVESMACGTPCIAFNHSGPKDIIDHEINGYRADYKDVNSLLSGMEYCLKHKKRLGKDAINKVKTNFSYQAVANKHINIYRNLLEKRENI